MTNRLFNPAEILFIDIFYSLYGEKRTGTLAEEYSLTVTGFAAARPAPAANGARMRHV